MVSHGLSVGFMLDRQWHWLRGEMDTTKKPALVELGRILARCEVPYALIGGLAVQIHHPDPRTTLDIDFAVLDRSAIPADALSASGFVKTGSFDHSENWGAADGTPVQFTDDVALAGAIANAIEIRVDDVSLRVITMIDLLHEKLRAAGDPARLRSKRLQDLADAEALIEAYPAVEAELRPEEQDVLKRLPH